MIDGIGKLHARMRNYGYWLMHDAKVGPEEARCVSLESKYTPEAGDVFEAVVTIPLPNVSDAECIHRYIIQLDHMEQYCLVARIMCMIGMESEYPAVFRMRRIGDHAMEKLANNAETKLFEALKLSA